jgi:CPA2 family monovalent cation:H+ antiporter-2
VGVTLGVSVAGHGIHRAVPAALTMAQIGEFSILIASVGLATGAAGQPLFVSVIAVAALTSATTPWLARRSRTVAAWLERHLPRPLQTFGTLYESWMEKLRGAPSPTMGRRLRRGAVLLVLDAVLLAAICVGAAAEMEYLADFLAGITTLSQKASQAVVVAAAVALAVPLVWGIVRRSQGLAHTIADAILPAPVEGHLDLAAAPRRSLVLAVHTIIALAVGLPLVALTQPMLPPVASAALLAGGLGALLVAFWRGAASLQGHVRAGAEVVLAALGRQTRTELPNLHEAEGLLPGMGSLVPWRVGPESPAVGRTLGELDLRARTGATVLAVFRPAGNVVAPTAAERIAADDVLAMTGSSEAVEAARRILAGKDTESESP